MELLLGHTCTLSYLSSDSLFANFHRAYHYSMEVIQYDNYKI